MHGACKKFSVENIDINEEVRLYERRNAMNFAEKWKKAMKLRKNDINETIRRIQEASKKVDPGSEEFKRLRADLEQEYKNKKLCREMRFMGISADKVLMVAVVLIIAGFGFALDMDSPKALKIAQFALKLPILKA